MEPVFAALPARVRDNAPRAGWVVPFGSGPHATSSWLVEPEPPFPSCAATSVLRENARIDLFSDRVRDSADGVR